ncbi:MarC family protein [Campylobacter jejuni]|nr:MarC family protein [Campylobacter jejuni]
MGSELYLMFFAAITLLAILNPFGNLTQFLAMSDGLPLMLRKKLFRTILYTAFTIVLVFLLSGPLFMNYIFRVSLDDLRVSGGLVLIIMCRRKNKISIWKNKTSIKVEILFFYKP